VQTASDAHPFSLSSGYRSSRELNHSFCPHLMPRLRINGAVLLLPSTPSWCGQHVFTFTCLIFSMSVDCFEAAEVTDSCLNVCRIYKRVSP